MDVRVTAYLAAGALLAAAPAHAVGGGLQGTFRVTLAAPELRAAGGTAQDAVWGVGTWTLVVAPGRWTLRQAGGVYGNAVDRGSLAGSGGQAAFTLSSADGFAHYEFLGSFRWRVNGRTLRFVAAVRPRNHDVVAILTARPWRRVSG